VLERLSAICEEANLGVARTSRRER
jgi:hypothetical protein